MTEARNAGARHVLLIACVAAVMLGCDDGSESVPVPQFTTQPSYQTAAEGQTATFTIAATGIGTLLYQWRKDGVDVTGGTGAQTASYTTPAATPTDSGCAYTCVVTDDNGGSTSNAAKLLVLLTAGKSYMTVDLASGAVSYSAAIADLHANDVYKTTQLVLRAIDPGTFTMGDQVGGHEANELPTHVVTLTRPFYMGVFEVTQKQWQLIEGDWPSNFTINPDKRPVECVTRDDINGPDGFMDTLSSLASATFRLPTEAEWEYCCKAGTSTNYFYGNTEDSNWMWYDGDQTHEVGTTPNNENPWGLCDMHGNVSEWCSDWFHYAYYENSPPDDPAGSTFEGSCMVRGGNYDYTAYPCRSAFREYHYTPGASRIFVGFRVVSPVP